MKKYLAIYLGTMESLAAWRDQDEQTKKEKEQVGMEAWSKWAKKNEKFILDEGAPLGKTKRIDKNGITDTRNEMGAYTVLQAESHEEAAKLFIDHPHFTHFPGESVEVMEFLPMPKM